MTGDGDLARPRRDAIEFLGTIMKIYAAEIT